MSKYQFSKRDREYTNLYANKERTMTAAERTRDWRERQVTKREVESCEHSRDTWESDLNYLIGIKQSHGPIHGTNSEWTRRIDEKIETLHQRLSAIRQEIRDLTK